MKTISDRELCNLLKNLDEYIDYLVQNKSSLLARIYGVYQIKMKDSSPFNVIFMKNCVQYENKYCLKKYQFKGFVNNERKVKKEDLEYRIQDTREIKTLYEQNFVCMKNYRKNGGLRKKKPIKGNI